MQVEKSRRDELSREKDSLQGQVAELGGMLKSQERLLELEKVGCMHAATAVRAYAFAALVLCLMLLCPSVIDMASYSLSLL